VYDSLNYQGANTDFIFTKRVICGAKAAKEPVNTIIWAHPKTMGVSKAIIGIQEIWGMCEALGFPERIQFPTQRPKIFGADP
jgi:hypothetical protein